MGGKPCALLIEKSDGLMHIVVEEATAQALRKTLAGEVKTIIRDEERNTTDRKRQAQDLLPDACINTRLDDRRNAVQNFEKWNRFVFKVHINHSCR